MPQVKITILGRIPSKKNSLRRIKRGRKIYTVPSEQHEQWHRLASLSLVTTKPFGLCHSIEASFWMPDNRRSDLHNKFESVADLLVDCGTIIDDSWQHTGSIRLIPMGVNKENPRVEITLTREDDHDTKATCA